MNFQKTMKKMKFNPYYTILILLAIVAGISSCSTTPRAFKADYAADYNTVAHTPRRPVLFAIKQGKGQVALSVCVFTEGMVPDSTLPGSPAWQFRAVFENWDPAAKTIVHSQTFVETRRINAPFLPDTVWLNYTGNIDTTTGQYLILNLTDQVTGLSLYSWTHVVDSLFPFVRDKDNNLLANQWIKKNSNPILPPNVSVDLCKTCDRPLPRPPFELQPVETMPPMHEWKSSFDITTNYSIPAGMLKVTSKETDSAFFLPLVSNWFPYPVNNTDGLLAIRYITTREEFFSLAARNDPKEALYSIWQTSASDKERAGERVRQFIAKITDANTFFTLSKPGSLTDQGLIWIVVGTPNRVWKSPFKETWFYDSLDDGLPLRLDFDLTTDSVGAQAWVLRRSPSYKTMWNRAVDRWRR
ncbi:MAG TPA: hypothetical protein DCR43_07820 [Bacteroidales bacterium]|nr:hypothetical protein [Bacteroidales bacterium]HBZ67203.1 hypothetical protein [Bacteroidales bacterium]